MHASPCKRAAGGMGIPSTAPPYLQCRYNDEGKEYGGNLPMNTGDKLRGCDRDGPRKLHPLVKRRPAALGATRGVCTCRPGFGCRLRMSSCFMSDTTLALSTHTNTHVPSW